MKDMNSLDCQIDGAVIGADYVREIVRAYISENFLFGDDAEMGDDESLILAGVIDSTSAFELAAFLEASFDIQVRERDIHRDNFDSIDRIVRYVTNRPPQLARA
jgi:acyl carrier protein